MNQTKILNKLLKIEQRASLCSDLIKRIDNCKSPVYDLEKNTNYPGKLIFKCDLIDLCDELYTKFKSISEKIAELIKEIKLKMNMVQKRKLSLLKREGNIAHHIGFSYSIRHKKDKEILRLVARVNLGKRNKPKMKTIVICKYIAEIGRPYNINGVYHKDCKFVVELIEIIKAKIAFNNPNHPTT